MFLRFIIGTRDPSSQVEAGLFAAAYQLRDQERLPDYDQRRLRELLAWFAENLVIPAPLSEVQNVNGVQGRSRGSNRRLRSTYRELES